MNISTCPSRNVQRHFGHAREGPSSARTILQKQKHRTNLRGEKNITVHKQRLQTWPYLGRAPVRRDTNTDGDRLMVQRRDTRDASTCMSLTKNSHQCLTNPKQRAHDGASDFSSSFLPLQTSKQDDSKKLYA